jgi:hypothetical protein
VIANTSASGSTSPGTSLTSRDEVSGKREVISGSLLFWGSALVLGSRRYITSLAIAVALSLTTFYAFAIGLGVSLPAGILQGIL